MMAALFFKNLRRLMLKLCMVSLDIQLTIKLYLYRSFSNSMSIMSSMHFEKVLAMIAEIEAQARVVIDALAQRGSRSRRNTSAAVACKKRFSRLVHPLGYFARSR
jgi:hypothetical protein